MNWSEKYCRPWFFLTVSAIIGAAALCVYVFGSVHIYTDVAYCYAYAIREAAVYGNWSYVLDPGLPILNMGLGSLIALTGVEALRSFMLVGGLFWILSIFPLYSLLKRFVSPLAASLGCLVFILTPKIMRFSCSGLLESARDFFFISALALLFSLSDRKTWGRLVLFAIALAGLALARAEGIVICAFFIVLLLADDLWLQRRSPTAKGFFRSLSFCAAAGVLFLILLSPKLIYNFQKTGYPTIDTRYNPYLDAFFRWNRFVALPPDAMPADSIANSANAYHSTGKFTWGENFSSVFSNMLRGGYEFYFGLALIGVLICVCRPLQRVYERLRIPVPDLVKQGWRWEYTVFVVLTLIHCILYFANCSAYRYYTFIVPMLLPALLITLHLTVAAVKAAPRKYHLPAVLLAAGLLIAAAQIDNGLSTAFTGSREWKIGCFLRDHAMLFRPDGRRVRVLNKHTRSCFFAGFDYANTSLNSKSKALTAREGDFDLAIFETDGEEAEMKALVEKYGLVPWDGHNPFPEDMIVFVPRRGTRR